MTSPNQFKLHIKAIGAMAEFAHFTVTNGYMDVVKKGYGKVDGSFPVGIYRITMRLSDQVTERFVQLKEDVDMQIDTPTAYSSIISPQFKSSHEYYTDKVAYFSRKVTAQTPLPEVNANSSLFLFFRYMDVESSRKHNASYSSLGKGFSILDADRNQVLLLTPGNIVEDIGSGWMAFHARLQTGTYFIRYEGLNANDGSSKVREMTIYVAARWQTQFYLMFAEEPLFSTARISFEDLADNSDKTDNNILLEGALQKFQNGIFYFPTSELTKLAHEKWYNPMLGLIAAYAYLSNSTTNIDPLFRQVMQNLPELLGRDCPDVRALQIMAIQHFGTSGAELNITISEPCMFLQGTRLIINKAVSAGGDNVHIYIPDDSTLDQISDKLNCDTVWTSYDASKLKYGEVDPRVLSEAYRGDYSRAKNMQFESKIDPDSWVADSLLYYAGKANKKLDVKELAAQLQVTANTVKKTINGMLENHDYFSKSHGIDATNIIHKLRDIT